MVKLPFGPFWGWVVLHQWWWLGDGLLLPLSHGLEVPYHERHDQGCFGSQGESPIECCLSLFQKADGRGIQQFRWIQRTLHLQLHDGILAIALQPATQLKKLKRHAFNQMFSRKGTWLSWLGLQDVNIRISMVFDGFLILMWLWLAPIFEVFVLRLGIWLQARRRLRVLPPRDPREASERPAAQGTAWCAEGSHLGPAAALGCGKARAAGDLADFFWCEDLSAHVGKNIWAKGLLYPPWMLSIECLSMFYIPSFTMLCTVDIRYAVLIYVCIYIYTQWHNVIFP